MPKQTPEEWHHFRRGQGEPVKRIEPYHRVRHLISDGDVLLFRGSGGWPNRGTFVGIGTIAGTEAMSHGPEYFEPEDSDPVRLPVAAPAASESLDDDETDTDVEPADGSELDGLSDGK